MSGPLAIGAGRRFRADPLASLREHSVNGAGEQGLIRFRAGGTDFTVIADPDEIHRVLVTDAELYGEGKWTLRGERIMRDCLITRDGDAHGERRALIQPTFDRARVLEQAGAIVGASEAMTAGWSDGAEVELRSEMGRMALAAGSSVTFGVDLGDRATQMLPGLLVMLSEIPRLGLPGRRALRLALARRRVDPMIAELIATRRHELGATGDAAPAAGSDALTTLLLHREPDGTPLTDRQIADEVTSLMIAFIDTTPGTLAWFWFELARHPELEREVFAELDDVTGGERPEPDQLSDLLRLSEVLDETLRLHPPVHFIDRRPLEDVVISGEEVKQGAYLLISPLLTQRDSRFHSDPDRFDPARWRGADRRTRPRYSFFPFGGGPHTCVGMALARIELLLSVATVARKWRLQPADRPLGGSRDLAEPGVGKSSFPMTCTLR